LTRAEGDDGPPAGWRATQILYRSPAARRTLVLDSLRALDCATEGLWFWTDLHRAADVGDAGRLEVAIATADGRVPTEWFRRAVARGLVERAVSVERPAVLDPDLFPGHRVPSAYARLLAATSHRALCLVGGEDAESRTPWIAVRDDVAAIYEALLPDLVFRREALVEYARWLERTVAPDGPEVGGEPLEEPTSAADRVASYADLGAQLQRELAGDDDGLVVTAARLAHVQALRLRPDGSDYALGELAIVRDLAERTVFPPGDRRTATRSSVFDHAARQLALVSAAVGEPGADAGVALLRKLGSLCGDHDAEDLPRWSCLGDDGSPFEISLTTSPAGHQVRFLVEAQSDPASPAGYWDAGCRLTRWLARELRLDLGWFDAVADLFGPATRAAYWAMWHGVDIGAEPVVKVYLNPRLGGRPPALVVADVMARLGFGSSWPAVEGALAAGGAPSHVSFDLGGERPRLKVYLRHEQDALTSVLDVARQVSPTAATDFATVCDEICGDRALLGRRPPFTTLYFHPGADAPARVALHLPVQSYVPDDRLASSRIRSLLESFALDPSAYDRAVDALSGQSPLTRGINSYVGFQRDESGPRVTTYFGARLYAGRHGWLARAPGRVWPSHVAVG
jgi:DMATS type aromatic prenyltransferase